MRRRVAEPPRCRRDTAGGVRTTSLQCPTSGDLPFHLPSHGFQRSTDDQTPAPAGINYAGAKARTTLTQGTFSKPFGGEYVSLWYDDSDAAEHRVDRRGVRHPLELGPQVFDAETRAWLDMFDFLKSAILSENGGDTADVYKTIWLRRLITTFGWVPYAACGNAPTDIIAYANAGIPLDRPQAARRPITMYARSATDASNAAVSWDAT